MRLRIRGPNGQSTITLPEDATVSDLQGKIAETTSINDFDVKYGYPPQPLSLKDHEPTTKLSDLDVKLSGEQLIVSDKAPPPPPSSDIPKPPMKSQSSSQIKDRSNDAPLSLTKKPPPSDTPEIALPTHGATLVLRVMPDDNSCMFRAL